MSRNPCQVPRYRTPITGSAHWVRTRSEGVQGEVLERKLGVSRIYRTLETGEYQEELIDEPNNLKGVETPNRISSQKTNSSRLLRRPESLIIPSRTSHHRVDTRPLVKSGCLGLDKPSPPGTGPSLPGKSNDSLKGTEPFGTWGPSGSWTFRNKVQDGFSGQEGDAEPRGQRGLSTWNYRDSITEGGLDVRGGGVETPEGRS